MSAANWKNAGAPFVGEGEGSVQKQKGSGGRTRYLVNHPAMDLRIVIPGNVLFDVTELLDDMCDYIEDETEAGWMP